MRISIHIRRVLLRLGPSPYTHQPNANMLSLIVGVCRIASFGVAITAGYTGPQQFPRQTREDIGQTSARHSTVGGRGAGSPLPVGPARGLARAPLSGFPGGDRRPSSTAA